MSPDEMLMHAEAAQAVGNHLEAAMAYEALAREPGISRHVRNEYLSKAEWCREDHRRESVLLPGEALLLLVDQKTGKGCLRRVRSDRYHAGLKWTAGPPLPSDAPPREWDVRLSSVRSMLENVLFSHLDTFPQPRVVLNWGWDCTHTSVVPPANGTHIGEAMIDGGSGDLPVSLSIMSLFLDRALPGVASTGRLVPIPGAGDAKVEAVRGITAKIKALVRERPGASKILVPAPNEAEARDAAGEMKELVRPVHKLTEVLDEAFEGFRGMITEAIENGHVFSDWLTLEKPGSDDVQILRVYTRREAPIVDGALIGTLSLPAFASTAKGVVFDGRQPLFLVSRLTALCVNVDQNMFAAVRLGPGKGAIVTWVGRNSSRRVGDIVEVPGR